MARKSRQDVAKAKAARQKKIAIGGAVVLVGLLAIQAPKMLKMMNQKPIPPVLGPAPTTSATAAGAPTDPSSIAAPTLAGAPPTATTAVAASPTSTTAAGTLVSAVPVTADPGQLQTFEKFATKDPFAAQATVGGGPTATSGGGSASKPKTPPPPPTPPTSTTGSSTPAPPAPTPTTAVISLNGELLSVPVNTDFPQSGVTFARAGAVFHLVSLTATTAKVAIAGGSYADGAAAITLKLKVPLTLQNTADGTKYTLILEPLSTPVTSTGGSVAGGAGTTTTPNSAVPSGSGG